MKSELDANTMDRVRQGTVLQLISSAGFYGAENVVIQLACQLERRNWRVIVGVLAAPDQPKPEVARQAEAEGLEVELVPCSGRVDLSAITFLRRKIAACEVDVVHSHNYKSNLYGCAAAKRAGVPIVATCHTWTGEALRLAIYGAIDRWFLRGFAAVVGVSGAVLDQLRRSGVREDRLLRIANGIDTDRFWPAARALEHPMGAVHTVLVGCAGRLTYQKGFDLLLRAAAEVVSQSPNVSFAIAGDGEEREKLNRLACSLGIESKIHFLGPVREMASFYHSLDIFVMPSRYEGMPMALLEAMASQQPIVAARVGQVPDLIEDGETGLLIRPDEPGELADAILRLVRNPDLASRMARRAHARVVERYSSQAMADRYLEVYRGAVRKNLDPAVRHGTVAGHEPAGI